VQLDRRPAAGAAPAVHARARSSSTCPTRRSGRHLEDLLKKYGSSGAATTPARRRLDRRRDPPVLRHRLAARLHARRGRGVRRPREPVGRRAARAAAQGRGGPKFLSASRPGVYPAPKQRTRPTPHPSKAAADSNWRNDHAPATRTPAPPLPLPAGFNLFEARELARRSSAPDGRLPRAAREARRPQGADPRAAQTGRPEFDAESKVLSAAKKLLDTRDPPTARSSTSVAATALLEGNTTPYPEPGVRLIRKDAVADLRPEDDDLRGGAAEAATSSRRRTPSCASGPQSTARRPVQPRRLPARIDRVLPRLGLPLRRPAGRS
jgi:hypothetical protein